MRIGAIARNTFREALRDRVLYLLFFFAAGAIVGSLALSVLAVGDKIKIIKDVGLASVALFGVLMAILMGTGLVYKEIDKKTILTLLAKPVRRVEFLLGKYLGLALTIGVMTGLMSLVFLALLLVQGAPVDGRLIAALGFTFIELLVIMAVAILFSTFSTPILSSLFSLAFFLIGHLSWSLEAYLRRTGPGPARTLLRAAYAILPDLENFNFRTEAVHGLPIPADIFLPAFAYGLVYAALLLALAALIFRRRDFV